MTRRIVALLIIGLLTVATAAPAAAITFGQLDQSNVYANVGALIGEFDVPVAFDENGEPITETLQFIFCTGTLIADADGGDSNLFLTAAHCIPPDDPTDGPGVRMAVTFDPTIDLDDTKFGSVVPGTSTMYEGTAYRHELFACCGRNDTFDIGMVVLDQEVPGISPATVVGPNQLGTMTQAQLRQAQFVTAGYGTVRDDKTGGFHALSFDGDRRWATQTAMNLLKPWLNLSMQPSTGDGGTCYGDSGGPHFLVEGGGLTLASITVTGDIPCRATDKTYRLDTPVSQEFIGRFLGF